MHKILKKIEKYPKASTNTRITVDMNIWEAEKAMEGEGERAEIFGGIPLSVALNQNFNLICDFYLFDRLGIYGRDIFILWAECCKMDENIYEKTIKAFRNGKFSKSAILENLHSEHPKAFV